MRSLRTILCVGLLAMVTRADLPMCETDADCEDGIACTSDHCVYPDCVFTPHDEYCHDVHFCNGSEWCDPVNDCQPGVDPCGGVAYCMEASECCSQCIFDHDCDDDIDADDFDRFTECFGQWMLCDYDANGLMRIPYNSGGWNDCCECNYTSNKDCNVYCEVFLPDFYGFAGCYEQSINCGNCDGPPLDDEPWWDPFIECFSDEHYCWYGWQDICLDGTCVECDDDGDCWEGEPYCSDKFTCVECRSSNHCTPPSGCCVNGSCAGCGS